MSVDQPPIEMTDEWLAKQFEAAFKLAVMSGASDTVGLARFQRGFANRVLMQFACDSERAKAALAIPFTVDAPPAATPRVNPADGMSMEP